MSKLIYSMGPSLDGYVAGRDGTFDWAVPDEELHRFHNEQTRELSAHLLGRNLYEVMAYWETAHESPDCSQVELEFANIWQALPKVVFSTTLESVAGNTRLATGGVADELAALRVQADGDIGVGGAGLAATCMELGLIDEYRLFVYPVVIGGGTPCFAAVADQIDLELVETRTFDSRVMYLRYRRA